ncbi:YezD family protein [Robertmurraya sp. DFI.2.37]|nr:YezD family protein [Robertmurraya sp. DFI.2.37]MDF1508530.1 YezD family protein [Robertmurraya sp. DFI.2.37]
MALKQAEWQNTFKHLEEMLATMKFGSITLVVQDGKIVQIEKNEKIRLP